MNKQRIEELLVYAAVCFEHCTSPFELIHLSKKKVKADECKELSFAIALILESRISDEDYNKALKEFQETQ